MTGRPKPIDCEEYARRLLTLLAEGHGHPAIARRLDYSERAIRRHIEALCRRSGCRSATQLAVWATRHGLICPAVPPAPAGVPGRPDVQSAMGGVSPWPTRIAS